MAFYANRRRRSVWVALAGAPVFAMLGACMDEPREQKAGEPCGPYGNSLTHGQCADELACVSRADAGATCERPADAAAD